MTADEAIRKYRETLSGIPDSALAISALAALFSGIRAHRAYKRGCHVLMAENFRQGTYIHATFNSACSEGVAEGMKPSLF